MRKVLTTTTGTIEGYTIVKYLKPMAANVVIGTNVLSDLGASFFDFFGGRYGGYEKKLQQMYDQVTAKLERKAASEGANGLLGLKIDIGEISGKTQMFMVTAYGTPVIMSSIYYENSNQNKMTGKYVDGEYVQNKMKARQLLSTGKSVKEFFNSDNIDFIVSTGFPDFIPIMLKGINYFSKKEVHIEIGKESAEKRLESIHRYFDYVDEEIVKEQLYNSLLTATDTTNDFLAEVVKILVKNDLLDYNKVDDLLKSDNILASKAALLLLQSDKSVYDEDDIDFLKNFTLSVDNIFQPVAEITTKKKLLSSSEKQVWNCMCGKSNDMDVKFCASCSKDIYGFTTLELKPKDVVTVVEAKLNIILERIGQESVAVS